MTRAPEITDPVALAADAELFAIEKEIDWLARVSPLDNSARYAAFVESGHTTAPPLTYPPFDLDVDVVRDRLDDLAIDDVENPTLEVLFEEKRNELTQMLTLLEARDTSGFTTASVSLFGGADPSLLSDAREILTTVPETPPAGPIVGADAVVAEAAAMRTVYAALSASFDFEIELVDDADAILVVHQGDLVVDRTLSIPAERVRPLVAHEVGVHVITRHNGRRQPLQLFESGFAHYDVLQEGLATFCEYLAGCLPPTRLRVLAARVVAADLAIRHEPLETIFHVLHGEHGLGAEPSFDVAVRAKRGGGLTKDAVYLEGLRQVHAWVGDGGDIAQLFLGKYSLGQRHLMADLVDQGVLVPPALLPVCITGPDAERRLADAITTPLTALCQSETPA